MDGKVLKKQDGKMRAESRWGGGGTFKTVEE